MEVVGWIVTMALAVIMCVQAVALAIVAKAFGSEETTGRVISAVIGVIGVVLFLWLIFHAPFTITIVSG